MAVQTRPAAPNYDSGIVTLPATLSALTAHVIRVDVILLCNLTTSKQTVTVTDRTGAGSERLNAYPLQPNMTIPVSLAGVQMDGVSWQAGAAASVNAQLIGEIG